METLREWRGEDATFGKRVVRKKRNTIEKRKGKRKKDA